MTTLSAQNVITREYGRSKNFMTPRVLEVGWIHNRRRAYELSKGEGFSHNTIYGVSIVDVDEIGTTKRRTDLGGCFESLRAARSHIMRLIEED